MGDLTYFEQKVAEALAQSKPQHGWAEWGEQWTADVSAVAYALDVERYAFQQSEFIAACGGLTPGGSTDG